MTRASRGASSAAEQAKTIQIALDDAEAKIAWLAANLREAQSQRQGLLRALKALGVKPDSSFGDDDPALEPPQVKPVKPAASRRADASVAPSESDQDEKTADGEAAEDDETSEQAAAQPAPASDRPIEDAAPAPHPSAMPAPAARPSALPQTPHLRDLPAGHVLEWDCPPPAPGARFNNEPEIPAKEKIALFLERFHGRSGIYAGRFLERDQARRPLRAGYVPVWRKLDAAVVRAHLSGEAVIGVYAMVGMRNCRFLILDFDEAAWRDDARAVIQAARAQNVPVYPEISRSGKGAHLWIFFSEPVSARLARTLGGQLLGLAALDFGSPRLLSYDRMFPSQDALRTDKSIGNLIALPLQLAARSRGASVFVDDELEPIEKQWSHIRAMRTMTPDELADTVEQLCAALSVDKRAVEAAAAAEAQRPANAQTNASTNAPSESSEEARPIAVEDFFAALPPKLSAARTPLRVELSSRIAIPTTDMTRDLRAALIRLSSFWNAEYLKRRRMMRSTFSFADAGAPDAAGERLVKKFVLADEIDGRFLLPRGLEDKVFSLLRENGIAYETYSLRDAGRPLDLQFQGELRPEQHKALTLACANDSGIIVAETGFGKTVLALAVIAKRACSTLVLVDKKILADQWISRISTFFGIPKKEVGIWMGASHRQTRRIDVASIGSLQRMTPEERLRFMSGYGLLIADECHHIGAGGAALVMQSFPGERILGLTATPIRRDGKMPGVFMLLGDILGRFRGPSVEERRLRVRQYAAAAPIAAPSSSAPHAAYQELLAAVLADPERLGVVREETRRLIEAGRKVLVLSIRVGHYEQLVDALQGLTPNVFTLSAEMGRRERAAVLKNLEALPNDDPLVLVSTGGLVGEGFDFPPLDAMVLAAPVSEERTVMQYVGRLLRRVEGKHSAEVVDIVDAGVPVFEAQFKKRRRFYEKLGFREADEAAAADPTDVLDPDPSCA